MNTIHKSSVFALVVAVMLCACIASRATAQETSRGTVVVYPVVFTNDSGDETAQRTAVQSVREDLQRAGYTMISNTVAANTWESMGFPMPTTDNPASTADIVRFGQAVHARYVVTPVFDFHTRSIWVVLGPRTVATATVNVAITDVEQGKTIYDRDVSGRSDEKSDFLIGGPKTPQEQRAVRLAVVKALRDWLPSSGQ